MCVFPPGRGLTPALAVSESAQCLPGRSRGRFELGAPPAKTREPNNPFLMSSAEAQTIIEDKRS